MVMVKGEEAGVEGSTAAAAAAAAAAQRKRQRVSRACDQCYSKKDRCDGGHPVCSICLKVGRPCSYDRPERKRGPMSGVRQRLEAQVEIIESVLGFILESFPEVGPETARQLDLDRPRSSAERDGSPTADLPPGDIFPRRSKQEYAKVVWRRSDLALCLRPALGLRTGGIEDHVDQDEMLDQAKHALVRLRRAASTSQGPGMARRFVGTPASSARCPGTDLATPSSSYEVGLRQSYGMASPSSFPFSDTRRGGEMRPQPHTSCHPPPPHRMWERSDSGPGNGRQLPDPQIMRTPTADFGQPWGISTDRHLARPAPHGSLPQAIERDLDVFIEAYLAYAHPMYPFLDRAQMRTWADEAKALRSHTATPPAMKRPSWVGDKATTALMAALVALGCAGFAASIYPSQGDDPNINLSERERLAVLGRDCGRTALQLLGEAVGASLPSGPLGPSYLARSDRGVSLRLTQAMLLLALTDMCLGETLQAWTLLGVACRVAQANGFDGSDRPRDSNRQGGDSNMHGRNRAMTDAGQLGPSPSGGSATSPTSSLLDANHADSSRRPETERAETMTWWSAWCLEVFVGAALGRAPMAERSSFDCPLPNPEGDVDEAYSMQLDSASSAGPRWEKGRIVTAFVAQIQLMEIVALEQRGGTGTKSSMRAIDLAASERVSQRLMAWASSLPPPLASALQASLYDAGDPLLHHLPHFRHVALLFHHARQLWRSHGASSSAMASLSILSGLSRSQAGAHRMPPLSSCLAIVAERSLLASSEPETTLHHARRIASDLCRPSALLWRPGLGHIGFNGHHTPGSSPSQVGRRPGGPESAYSHVQQPHMPSEASQQHSLEGDAMQDRRFASFAALPPTEAELDDHAHALAYALGMTDAMPQPSNGGINGAAPFTGGLRSDGPLGVGFAPGPGPSPYDGHESSATVPPLPRGSLTDPNVAYGLMADFGAAAVQAVQQQQELANPGLNLSPRQMGLQGSHSSILHQLGLQGEAERVRRPSFLSLSSDGGLYAGAQQVPASGQRGSGDDGPGGDAESKRTREQQQQQPSQAPHHGPSVGAYNQDHQR